MIRSPMQGVVQHLRKAVLVQDGAGLTDAQLLTLFISGRDEAAFEALVRRHGPMVLGVCRRLLRNSDDAEDAFQATFLVLVRKAASIVPREMVPNWLYGVARTTALRANALAAKRRVRERQVKDMPEPEAAQQDLWDDLQPLLDHELGRLPDKYRVAIVLCDLEGKSHKEAARQLDWPQGTLSGRLVRGRKLLTRRLARHGLAVSGGAVAGALSQTAASACVPPSLVSSTVKAASVLAAGQTAVAGLISVKAAILTEGVVKAMLLHNLKTVTTVFLLAALAGGTGLFYRTQAAESADDAPRTTESEPSIKEQPQDRDNEVRGTRLSGRDSLPSGSLPQRALFSLDKGQLAVRTSYVTYEMTAVLIKGKAHTSPQKTVHDVTKTYITEMVKVYDIRGKSIDTKKLPDLLKRETLALVSTDPHAADPANLTLFKEGTLLFILPSPLPPSASNFAPYYAPAPPTPATGAILPPQVIEGYPQPQFTPPPTTPAAPSGGQDKKP